MTTTTRIERCTTCNKPISGRLEKRFCDIKCKNEYHESVRKLLEDLPSYANKRIKKNYTILEGIFGYDTKSIRIHQNDLFKHGFDLTQFTKVISRRNRRVYELFEYKIFALGNGVFEISRSRSRKFYPEIFLRRWAAEFSRSLKVTWDVFWGGLRWVFERKYNFETTFLTVNPFNNNT